MNSRLFFWALTSSLAGFLFGFDTAVISGVEQTIEKLWGLSVEQHGIAIGIALWGTVLGAFVGGWPTDHWGRKKTLLAIGAFYSISAIWSALANDVNSFMIARFIGGLGVGISTVAAPLYISEISPPEMRGRLAGMFQFNIVFGILVALLSNYLLGKSMSEDAWRWMLGVEAVPAVLYTFMCLGLPQSPRWLISKRGDRPAAEAILRQLYGDEDDSQVAKLAGEIEATAAKETAATDGTGRFWSRRLRIPILLAFLVAFFNQLSGINAILYFAPRIFQLAGFGENASLLNSVGIGLTNLVFTFVGLYLIDRLGRRTLLYIGSFGYIASLGLCSWVFFTYAAPFQVANSAITVKNAANSLERIQSLQANIQEDVLELTQSLEEAKEKLQESVSSEGYLGPDLVLPEGATGEQLAGIIDAVIEQAGGQSGSGGMWVMLSIFAFIAAHAVGQGAVIWVLISEIFPNQYRATGQALGSFTHWLFAALLTSVFPWMIGTFDPGAVFGFFCFMMVLQLLWVATMVPETKGVPLEEMQQRLGIE